jgi:hypothetical protein
MFSLSLFGNNQAHKDSCNFCPFGVQKKSESESESECESNRELSLSCPEIGLHKKV